MAQSVSETESSINRRLTLSSLATVRDALYGVRSKWEDIGIELLSKSDTDAIKMEKGNDVGSCLTEMLSVYLRRANPEPSWSSIVAALKASAVGESQLAQELEKKYLNQTATLPRQQNVEPARIDHHSSNISSSNDREASVQQSLSPDQEEVDQSIVPSFPYLDTKKLSPHEKTDLIQRLSRDYTNILTNFAKLQTSTCESLCKQNISAERIANCALSLAQYKSDDVPRPLLDKEQESFEEVESVVRVFFLLRKYKLISYFDHGILKHIIETYGTEDDKSKLQKYVDEFRMFCQHKVVEVPPVISECTSSTRKIFKVLITADIKATLIDIAAAERKIADILGLTHSVLTLHEITPGSLVLTLSIPILIADKIFPVQASQLSQLKANGFAILYEERVMAVSTVKPMDLESHLPPEEQPILELLKKIEDIASEAELEQALYEFRGLLPSLEVPRKIVDSYLALRQSDYCQTALSLVSFIVQSMRACSPDRLEKIQNFIWKYSTYEADERIPSLMLRLTLARVTNQLTDYEDQADNFIQLAAAHLQLHTDKIKKNVQRPVLKVFDTLEERGSINPKDTQLACVSKWLKIVGRMDLVTEHITSYNPYLPIRLAVMKEVKRLTGDAISPKSSLDESARQVYTRVLIDTYKSMPLLPLDAWPPIKKQHYVSLALITSATMSQQDFFSRTTIRGSVDDIYREKRPIEFKDVFPAKIDSEKRYIVLIEGRPGAGKSTLVTKVSIDWANGEILQDVEIFVLVRLRRFLGKEQLTLEDLFGIYSSQSSLISSLIKDVSQTGGKGVCFAFDGLDEYKAVFGKDSLIRDLIDGKKLPNSSIYMLSRPAGSHRLRNSVRLTYNIEIIGFLEKEIQNYIIDYYEDQPAKAHMLRKYLEDHPNIARMCYIPLHLAMIVFLYDLGPEYLPDTETDLYDKFVLHTLRRAIVREMDVDEDDDLELDSFAYIPGKKKDLFKSVCQLAFEATCEQKQIFTGKEIIESGYKFPVEPDMRSFNSLGLLLVDKMTAESSLPTKTFSFLHLTLQEFLSAVHLTEYTDEVKQLELINKFGGSIHMWVVWKFYCGLNAVKTSRIFADAFRNLTRLNISDRLGHLHLIHCAFESQKQTSCAEVLIQLKGSVDVQDIALNPSDCAALGDVFSKAPQELKELDLSYCHIGPAGIQTLSEKVTQELPKAVLLRLRARTDYNPVGSEGAIALRKFLGRLPNLKELRLYGNKLQSSHFKILSPMIAHMQHLKNLILSQNDLDESTGATVAEVVENLSKLEMFYFSYNPLRDEGLKDMKRGLLKCLNLKILGLCGTSLEGGAGQHLGEILATLPKLEWVELYQNRLGDQGVIDMLPGLKKAKSLQIMSLVENEITDKGAIAFSEYLSITTTLTEMRMYYNHGMTDKGKIALRTAVLERDPNLCELKFAV